MFAVLEGANDPSLPIVTFILDEDEAQVLNRPEKYESLSDAITAKLARVYE
jgi:hypothetical protein